ncbi:MAG: tetratricopeptide repeat protein [Cyanobacteriota bacterium]|nr:tetratricopeptide repeat protein [Cyanobacteriota bacterium]
MELLELYLSPLENQTRFKVIVTHSPAGEGETESSLPFLDGDRDWRITIIRTLEVSSFSPDFFSAEGEQDWMVAAGVLVRDRSLFHHDYLVNIGRSLYRSLFPQGSRVERLLQQSIGLAESKSSKLVVRLKLEEDVVKRSRLADYPWELLHERGFLCHHQVEFARYIAYGAVPPNLPTADKLNVLLVSSAASDSELDLKRLTRKEQKAVRKGLETASGRGDISLNKLEEPTLAELRAYLSEPPGDKGPHVLHFDGHGLFGKRCPNPECRAMNPGPNAEGCRKCNTQLPSPQGYLVFEDEDGDAHYISAKELGTLLQQSGLSDGGSQTGGVALVVLSACQSGMAIVGESVFNGAAQKLIAHRLPAVVAMQYSVEVDSATKFTEQFYRSLGQKNSLAVAVSQGREAMGVEGNQWYRPVLYLRWQDNQGGQLFASGTSPQTIPQNLRWTGAKNFVGRGEDLKNLHQKLQETERVAITSITGMGGIGKTELALQYAHGRLHQKTYPGGVCWLDARGAEVGIQILSFARSQLNLNPPEDEDLKTQIRYCWRNWQQGEVLVIFDDVAEYEQISNFLPPAESRFKVLITTRCQDLGQSFQRLELEVLEEGAALELLVSFVGEGRIKGEPEEAKALCGDLGFLPLGLELVARYLERRPDLSLAKARQRLESKRLKHKSLKRKSKDMTAERGLAAAFELSWEELDSETRELGRLLSLFAPAAIPWWLVAGCLPEVDEEDLEDWQSSLVSASLLQRLEEGSYQLHLLIREFFRGKLPESNSVEEMKRGVCRVMVAEAEEIPQTPTREDILRFEPAIPHISEVAAKLTHWLSDDDLILPFFGLGRFYKGQGLYDFAEPWLEQCREITQSRLEPAHPYIATSLNNLAFLYNSLGRYAEAEPLYLEALEMRKQLLGSAHPYIATSLNNLALLYESQGRYAEAEPLYLEALEMRKQLLGSAHPDIASSLNNLAGLYNSLGRYAEAEPLYLEALDMHKQLLGSAHPYIASSLNNLAALYKSQGRYAEAEPLYLEALEMRKQLLGSAHPYIASSLNNLAALYKSQGRYAEAEPLYLEALEMRKQLLGSAHPDIAQSLNNLAGLYESQGRYAEAEPLYLEALEMRKQLLGSAHPDIASSLNNLALLYKSQERYAEAEPLYLEALDMHKQLLGSAHPYIASSLNNLAALYKSQGRYAEAEPLLIEALDMHKQLLGSAHPDIATSLNNLAALYESQGRYAEAEPLYLEALEMRKQLLGSAHPYIASSLNNLAALYKSQGRYAEAEPLYLEAVTMFVSQLGEEHPHTQKVRQNYQKFLQQVASENRQGELSYEGSLQIISQMESEE